MFCKSVEDLQLCPSGGSVEDTGRNSRYMAFGPLCDPSESFVCILASRSSVFSVSVGLPTVGHQGVQEARALRGSTGREG